MAARADDPGEAGWHGGRCVCHMVVWGMATELWAEGQRGRRETQRERDGADSLDGCDADTPGVHEEELLRCPLLRATYQRAVDELMLRREQSKCKRRLSLQDRNVWRWRDWSMMAVIAWWQAETVRRGGGAPPARLKRKKIQATPSVTQRTLADVWGSSAVK